MRKGVSDVLWFGRQTLVAGATIYIGSSMVWSGVQAGRWLVLLAADRMGLLPD